jgi:uncharacterized protein RhaS with RHS repeats
MGRYVEGDPIGLEGGLNPYRYAGGNPLRYVDSLGLQEEEDEREKLEAITGSLARGYTYHAAGGMLTYGSITATYNNHGQLKTLTNGAVTATYFYNALGHLSTRNQHRQSGQTSVHWFFLALH